MTRVLVAWEDHYFRGLEALVRKHLARQTPAGDDALPVVLHHTTRGNSRFQHYVADTWTNVRSVGLPNDSGPIDHLVCVIDADKLCELHPAIARQPDRPDQVDAWHATASAAWRDLLRGWVHDSVPKATVHGVVLRWSRESAVLAGWDQTVFHEGLCIDPDHAEVRALLQKGCKPPPSTVSPARFGATWQRPMKCLEQLFRAQSRAAPSKNDPVYDDVLRALARDALAPVIARMPDLDTVVRIAMAPDGDTLEPAPPTAARKTRRSKRT